MAGGPEMDLISQSVDNASARIRFFRIAYGAGSDQAIGRSEIVSVIKDMMGAGRLSVAWGPLEPQQRSLVRMAFLGIQCLETAMPYGGRIEVFAENNRWVLHGKSEKLNINNDLWDVLSGKTEAADIAPAHVQFALLPAVAPEVGRKIRTEVTDTDLRIYF